MKRLLLITILFVSTTASAQSLHIKGCQPNFVEVLEEHCYNVRKSAPPVAEPTPPLPNGWRYMSVPMPPARTPGPVGSSCATDAASTYFDADATMLDGPGVWNTWLCFALSKDGIGSDLSNIVTPPGSKAFAPVLLP